jgi:tRNA A37 threonylcarbamoyladenosine synthetase subunit TsaC/SUA5/YrdC
VQVERDDDCDGDGEENFSSEAAACLGLRRNAGEKARKRIKGGGLVATRGETLPGLSCDFLVSEHKSDRYSFLLF